MFWKLLATYDLIVVAVLLLSAAPLVQNRVVSPNQPCPDACLCRGAAWNCSQVVDLGQLRPGDHVKSLTLYESRVDLEGDLRSHFPALEELRVDGSSKIRCPQSSTWLLEWTGRLVDAEELACYWPKDLHGTLLPKVLSLMKEVQSQCPEFCLCELVNVPRTTAGPTDFQHYSELQFC